MPSSRELLTSLVVLLVPALSACSGGGTTASTVTVRLSEYRLVPSAAPTKVGDVIFKAENNGTLAHELVVIKTDRAQDALVLNGAVVDEAASGQKVGQIEQNRLPAGNGSNATMHLAAGKYVLICNVAGHYVAGMHAALTVI